MKFLDKLLIPGDYANHFIYGTIIFIVSLFFMSGVMSLIPVGILAVAKAYYDNNKHGDWDAADLIFTIMGGLLPLIARII